MGRRILTAVLAGVFLLAAGHVRAAIFLNSYDDWRNAGLGLKNGFVMGFWDSYASVYVTDKGWAGAKNDGLQACSGTLGLSSRQLVEAVDAAYAANADLRDQPPYQVLIGVTHNHCLTFINERLKKRGLPPWPHNDAYGPAATPE